MKYLFVDIETTGLDESDGYILEVALVAVTEDFEVLDCTNFIVDYNGHRGTTQRQVFYENTNEITMEMHSKNGLKEEFCSGDLQTRVKISEVAQHISQFIEMYWDGDRYNKPILAGSNPTFDKSWLEAHFPVLSNFWHYRVFDLNTLYMFFDHKKDTTRNHRALTDILADLDFVITLKNEYEELTTT